MVCAQFVRLDRIGRHLFVVHNYQSIIFLGDVFEYWSTEGRGCSYQGLYQLQYLGTA